MKCIVERAPGSEGEEMFIVLLKYTQPLEVIDSLMGEHVRFLRRHIKEKVFIVAGRQVPRRGGVIFARGSTPPFMSA